MTAYLFCMLNSGGYIVKGRSEKLMRSPTNNTTSVCGLGVVEQKNTGSRRLVRTVKVRTARKRLTCDVRWMNILKNEEGRMIRQFPKSAQHTHFKG